MKWEDLPFGERVQYIRTSVKNGLTNINDIKNAYHKFVDGGEKKVTDTGGGQESTTNPLLQNFPQSFYQIDKYAATGKPIQEAYRQRNPNSFSVFDPEKIYNRVPGENITSGNFGVESSLRSYLWGSDNNVMNGLYLQKEKLGSPNYKVSRLAADSFAHEDAKDHYFGYPQRTNSVILSPYRPTIKDNPNDNYYTFRQYQQPSYRSDIYNYGQAMRHRWLGPNDAYKFLGVDGFGKKISPWSTADPEKRNVFEHPWNSSIHYVKDNPNMAVVSELPIIQNATVSLGSDRYGPYTSVFDIWDYNTDFTGVSGDNVGWLTGGKPFYLLDRVYDWEFDDSIPRVTPNSVTYDENNEPTFEYGYLPEIMVHSEDNSGTFIKDKNGKDVFVPGDPTPLQKNYVKKDPELKLGDKMSYDGVTRAALNKDKK